MPFAPEINDFYWDFGNGYVPFFGVIGAYNIFMYGDNDLTPATNMVPNAIESFNHMGVTAPIADRNINFWGYEFIEISEMFATPTGNPITIALTGNSNPDIASVELVDNIITVIVGSEMGSTEITITGDDGSDETVDDVFTITTMNPNLLSYEYNLEDSPVQGLYPNNPNPYSNTFTDFGWTSLAVTDTDEIANLHLSLMWESVDYASEGTFHATSPAGTDVLLYSAANTTPTQLELDIVGFNGEAMNGDWTFYMIDSFGDGGHQVSDATVTLMAISTEIGMVAGLVVDAAGNPLEEAVLTVSNIATLTDDLGQFQFDILSGSYTFSCEASGYEVAEIDADITTGNLTFLDFELIEMVDTNDLPTLNTELLNNYPNPFNPVTNIAFSLDNASHVTLEIFNVKGEKVKTLIDSELPADIHHVVWNGSDSNNKSVSSGVYFYKMKAGTYTSTRKMILLK